MSLVCYACILLIPSQRDPLVWQQARLDHPDRDQGRQIAYHSKGLCTLHKICCQHQTTRTHHNLSKPTCQANLQHHTVFQFLEQPSRKLRYLSKRQCTRTNIFSISDLWDMFVVNSKGEFQQVAWSELTKFSLPESGFVCCKPDMRSNLIAKHCLKDPLFE